MAEESAIKLQKDLIRKEEAEGRLAEHHRREALRKIAEDEADKNQRGGLVGRLSGRIFG